MTFYRFDSRLRRNYYNTATWLVSTDEKIISIITTDIDTLRAKDVPGVSTVQNINGEECTTRLVVYEKKLRKILFDVDNYDVTVMLTSPEGVMEGCELRNIKNRGDRVLFMLSVL